MGIDRIGNKGPPAPPPPEKARSSGRPSGSVDRPSEATAPFEIARPAADAAHGAAPVDASPTPLERYRAGEIDLGGYLDLKVDEATAHLAALPAHDLQAIRSALRERLASDPTLLELVQTATGHVPEPPGDE